MRRPLAAALLLLAAGAIGCGGGDGASGPGTPVPDHIALSQTSLSLGQTASAQLAPVVVDRNGAPVAGAVVTYASADQALVTVTPAGLVKSVGPTGSTVVTLTSGALHRDLPVTVVTAVGAVAVAPDPVALAQKGTVQLAATVHDVTGAPLTGRTLVFASADESIVTVSGSGLVTSVGPAGATTIRVTDVGAAVTTIVPVTVTQVATSIAARTTYVLLQNSAQRIAATVLDAVGTPIAGAPVTFTSSDRSLVSVAADGTVQSGGGTGAADVTVRSGTVSLVVHVRVLASAHPAGVLDGTTPLAGASAVAVSHAGTAYVSGIWTDVPLARADLPSHTLTQVLPTDGTSISGIVFDSAGTTAYLAAARAQNALLALDVADGTTRWSVPLESGASAVALAPDERTVYVITATNTTTGGQLLAIDVATRTVTATWPVEWYMSDLAVAPDGRHLYVSQYGNQEIVIVDLETRQISGRIHTEGRPRGLVVSLDATELYVANWEHAEVTVFDLATGQRVGQIGLVEQPSSVALTPDGTQIYATLPAYGVQIVDRATRTSVRTINVLSGAAHVAFAPDGSTAVVTLNGSGQVVFIK